MVRCRPFSLGKAAARPPRLLLSSQGTVAQATSRFSIHDRCHYQQLTIPPSYISVVEAQKHFPNSLAQTSSGQGLRGGSAAAYIPRSSRWGVPQRAKRSLKIDTGGRTSQREVQGRPVALVEKMRALQSGRTLMHPFCLSTSTLRSYSCANIVCAKLSSLTSGDLPSASVQGCRVAQFKHNAGSMPLLSHHTLDSASCSSNVLNSNDSNR